MSGSDIAKIVDYCCLVAARVQGVKLPNGQVVGVAAVYGAGQGFYPDPLRPGQMVQPIGETIKETFEFHAEVPDAPSVMPETQNGTIRVEWDVPMRLVLLRGDLATTRQIALPFYDAFLREFWTDRRLGNLCQLAYITTFQRGGDGTWAWLDMSLRVIEYVAY
jgi:hypothetical protein